MGHMSVKSFKIWAMGSGAVFFFKKKVSMDDQRRKAYDALRPVTQAHLKPLAQ